MVVQCCVWEDSDKYCERDTLLLEEKNEPDPHPNELTPLRAPTFGSTSGISDTEVTTHEASKENESVVSTVNKNHPENLSKFTYKTQNLTFMHRTSISPLVFPTMLTSMYQLVFTFSPIGGAGNPAMGLSQINGLRQVVSISGEISLIFWIGWLASIIVRLGIMAPPSSPKSKNRIPNGHLVSFIMLTLAMFVYGSMRERSGRGFYFHDISQWPTTRANEAPIKVSCLTRSSGRKMIARTNERLAAGDDLILWSEAAIRDSVLPDTFEWNENNTGAVVVATSYKRIHGKENVYNQVQMMQEGSVIAHYAKNRPVPIIESHVMGGDRAPHSTEVTFTPQLATCGGSKGGFLSQIGVGSNNYCTASGKPPRQDLNLKTAMAICFDFDFSYLLRQASDSDLVIGPSWYWASMGTNLWEHNIFRAIENGFTLIKCSEYGISGAVDPFGRTIAALPTLNDRVYTFEVPVQKGVETFFESGGWMFGWICVGLSPLLLLLAVAGRLAQ
eukprot:scaffold61142_cov57-Cyclotella_meneghiniana.AAC.9